PYTQALLDSVLTPDPHLGIPDLGLHGTFPNPMSPPSGCAFHPRCRFARPTCSSVAPPTRYAGEQRYDCVLDTPVF
ncbi:ABC transporter ATP-binding protein, partial [Pseudomonas syringae pv. actinidiae]|nr:ABC transporter ATP-binding protein [Pseudomonas syringae pv. actinidiae]